MAEPDSPATETPGTVSRARRWIAATSAAVMPNGHFTKTATQSTIANVSTGMSGGQSVFVDDNGQAYLAFSDKSGRSRLHVAQLRPSDFL